MPVCLHCGEIGAEGALFCGKCGYTLPQPGSEAAPPAPTAARPPGPVTPSPAPAAAAAPAGVLPPRASAPYAPVGVYAVPVAGAPGAVGPMPAPPNAKYCARCGTLISAAAVYCPVCQQPQA